MADPLVIFDRDLPGAPAGTPIRSAHNGTVAAVTESYGGCGRTVHVRGDDGFVTVYCHNSRNLVQPNQRVIAGQTVIAEVGSSGNASPSSPHVHFEVHTAGQLHAGHIDPRPWLAERGVRI